MTMRTLFPVESLKKMLASYGIFYKPRLAEANWGSVIDKDFFCEFDVLIVSAGGCGCSLIHDLLDKRYPAIRKNLNSDKDGLKHLSSPRQNLFIANSFKSILYIYNDPLLGILSHYRRGWHVMQHKKICDPKDVNVEKIRTFDAFCSSVKNESKDVFGVENHLMNWFAYRNELNISFVDFRNPLDASSKLSSLLGVDISYVVKSRSRSTLEMLESLDPHVLDVYSDIDKHISSLIQGS